MEFIGSSYTHPDNSLERITICQYHGLGKFYIPSSSSGLFVFIEQLIFGFPLRQFVLHKRLTILGPHL